MACPLDDGVAEAVWRRTGVAPWQLLIGDVPVHALYDAQFANRGPPRDPPVFTDSPRRPSVAEPAVDESTVMRDCKLQVRAPCGLAAARRPAPATPRDRKRTRNLPEPDLLPAIAFAPPDFLGAVEDIERGNPPTVFTAARFGSDIPIEDHWRATRLLRASKLTQLVAVRKRYEEAALKLVSPPAKLCDDSGEHGCFFPEDPDDKLVRANEPGALEKETKPYRDWHEKALATKTVSVDASPEQLQSMNYYPAPPQLPSIDELVDGTWEPTPARVPEATMTVPANPEGLDNGRGYTTRGIGHLKVADYDIDAALESRAAKRRAIESGAPLFGPGGFDPFGPQELGGMPPPPPPPSLEMADMLKPRNHAVATFRTFSSIGPPEGMHLFVYDELCPPLRAVRGMLTETSLFYQRGANLRPYRDFPFTRRLEYAGSHEDGPLFAPVEGTPQAIADNEHMRAYIAPARVTEARVTEEETTDFVVRMRNGKIVEIVPVQNPKVAVGQVFPKHRKKSYRKELEALFYNRVLARLFNASRKGLGRPWNLDRLVQLRPSLMTKKDAIAALKTFTVPVGPKLFSYDYKLGMPELRQECTYTLALLQAAEHYARVRDQATPTRRAIDPLATVGVLEKYLEGTGLLLTGGWGAPDPWAVNLSGLQTLKTGTCQKKSDLQTFPEIVGGMYPLPRPKDNNGKTVKRREGSSSDRRRMTRSQYSAELLSMRRTVKCGSEDATLLDELLGLIRDEKDTTSDRWRIIRFLSEHDTKTDPTLHMTQNALRRFSMRQLCSSSCRATVYALFKLAQTGRASIEGMPAGPRFAHEIKTRELVKAPFLRRFTYYVLYRGGAERTFTAGDNSPEAWAHKTVYTARKLMHVTRLLTEFGNQLFHAAAAEAADLRVEIAEVQEQAEALERELLAGMPLDDAYATRLVARAKSGRL